ncbi:hypothetical protein NDU88_003606 [Pleurodeles waltl]|uniref:Uncharacterized protein n=1 Tax=Pleurodeles waltl TaxID=8319 RepID=A0AAV7WVB1_PLEWA|nr:hypothetical protein NDU88_003606 [Pleurodeles waltl]
MPLWGGSHRKRAQGRKDVSCDPRDPRQDRTDAAESPVAVRPPYGCDKKPGKATTERKRSWWQKKEPGAFDILSRCTILKLINGIQPLAHISTIELMTVEFIQQPNNKDKEATLTSWPRLL